MDKFIDNYMPYIAQWFDQDEDRTRQGGHENHELRECWGEEWFSLRKDYLSSPTYFFLFPSPSLSSDAVHYSRVQDAPLRIDWQIGGFYLDFSTLLGIQP